MLSNSKTEPRRSVSLDSLKRSPGRRTARTEKTKHRYRPFAVRNRMFLMDRQAVREKVSQMCIVGAFTGRRFDVEIRTGDV